jgi:hypothetical protein
MIAANDFIPSSYTNVESGIFRAPSNIALCKILGKKRESNSS